MLQRQSPRIGYAGFDGGTKPAISFARVVKRKIEVPKMSCGQKYGFELVMVISGIDSCGCSIFVPPVGGPSIYTIGAIVSGVNGSFTVEQLFPNQWVNFLIGVISIQQYEFDPENPTVCGEPLGDPVEMDVAASVGCSADFTFSASVGSADVPLFLLTGGMVLDVDAANTFVCNPGDPFLNPKFGGGFVTVMLPEPP